MDLVAYLDEDVAILYHSFLQQQETPVVKKTKKRKAKVVDDTSIPKEKPPRVPRAPRTARKPKSPLDCQLPTIPTGANIVEHKRNSIIIFDVSGKKWLPFIISKYTPFIALGEFESFKQCQVALQEFKREKKRQKILESTETEQPHGILSTSIQEPSLVVANTTPQPPRRISKSKKPKVKPTFVSSYRGVKWNSVKEQWTSSICRESLHIDLGVFETEEDAARAYNDYAVKMRGPKSRTINKIPFGNVTARPGQTTSLAEEVFLDDDYAFMSFCDKMETGPCAV